MLTQTGIINYVHFGIYRGQWNDPRDCTVRSELKEREEHVSYLEYILRNVNWTSNQTGR